MKKQHLSGCCMSFIKNFHNIMLFCCCHFHSVVLTLHQHTYVLSITEVHSLGETHGNCFIWNKTFWYCHLDCKSTQSLKMSVFDSQGSNEKCIIHAFNYPTSPHQSTLKSYLHVNFVDSILFSHWNYTWERTLPITCRNTNNNIFNVFI